MLPEARADLERTARSLTSGHATMSHNSDRSFEKVESVEEFKTHHAVEVGQPEERIKRSRKKSGSKSKTKKTKWKVTQMGKQSVAFKVRDSTVDVE